LGEERDREMGPDLLRRGLRGENLNRRRRSCIEMFSAGGLLFVPSLLWRAGGVAVR